MARTKADSFKKAAVKAPRKAAALSGGAASSSNPGVKSNKHCCGGNTYCPRPTPAWQKPITTFFKKDDAIMDEAPMDIETKDAAYSMMEAGCSSSFQRNEMNEDIDESVLCENESEAGVQNGSGEGSSTFEANEMKESNEESVLCENISEAGEPIGNGSGEDQPKGNGDGGNGSGDPSNGSGDPSNGSGDPSNGIGDPSNGSGNQGDGGSGDQSDGGSGDQSDGGSGDQSDDGSGHGDDTSDDGDSSEDELEKKEAEESDLEIVGEVPALCNRMVKEGEEDKK